MPGEPSGEVDARAGGDLARDVDDAAWRVLHDLLTPDGAFATLAPEGLQELIGLRLAREADRLHTDRDVMARAFERALREFTGTDADRPETPSTGTDADTPPEETGERGVEPDR